MRELNDVFKDLLNEYYGGLTSQVPIQLFKEIDGFFALDKQAAYASDRKTSITFLTDTQITEMLTDPGIQQLLKPLPGAPEEGEFTKAFSIYDFRDHLQVCVWNEILQCSAQNGYRMSIIFKFREGAQAEIFMDSDSLEMMDREFMKVLRFWPDFGVNFLMTVLLHYGYRYLNKSLT